MPTSPPDSAAAIQTVLGVMRRHLDLDVAFVSHLVDDQRVFRFVDLAAPDERIAPGGSGPAEESYCHHVVRGALPGLLHEPAQHPVSAAIEATHTLPVGTHLSVPIVLCTGQVYGTLCAFGHDLRPDLDDRDLSVLRVLAEVIAGEVERFEVDRLRGEERAASLRALRPGRDLVAVFQPIVDLRSGALAGVETLARFPGLGRGPAEVFAEATAVGVGEELEVAAVQLGIAALGALPPEVYLSVNLSPATLVASDRELLGVVDHGRLVVEITEHAAVADYAQLNAVLATHRAAGVRLAVDDVGAGFAGLDQILQLQPELLKLDGALVADIDRRADKQAMVAAIATYAGRLGVGVVAERIETAAERDTLTGLGVPYGQGYLLGRPAPLAELAARWWPEPEGPGLTVDGDGGG